MTRLGILLGEPKNKIVSCIKFRSGQTLLDSDKRKTQLQN